MKKFNESRVNVNTGQTTFNEAVYLAIEKATGVKREQLVFKKEDRKTTWIWYRDAPIGTVSINWYNEYTISVQKVKR